MANWRDLWGQLYANNTRQDPDWDDLVHQARFLRECAEGVTCTTNLEVLRSAISDLEHQVKTRACIVAERNAIQDVLNGIPLDARIDPQILHNGILGPPPNRQLRHFRSEAGPIDVLVLNHLDLRRLAKDSILHTDSSQTSQDLEHGMSENVHDVSWYRNPGLEYHESMEGHNSYELPRYHNIFKRTFTKHDKAASSSPIEHNPDLNANTLGQARDFRRYFLSTTDSTYSECVLPPYEEEIYTSMPHRMSSTFLIDPRTKHSSDGARQIGVLRSPARMIRRIAHPQSVPDFHRPRLSVDTKVIEHTKAERRSLTHMLEASEVDHEPLSAQSSPIELLLAHEAAKVSLATGNCESMERTAEQNPSQLPDMFRSSSVPQGHAESTSIHSADISAIEESHVERNDWPSNSAHSPAFSWATSVSIEIAPLSANSHVSRSTASSEMRGRPRQRAWLHTPPNFRGPDSDGSQECPLITPSRSKGRYSRHFNHRDASAAGDMPPVCTVETSTLRNAMFGDSFREHSTHPIALSRLMSSISATQDVLKPHLRGGISDNDLFRRGAANRDTTSPTNLTDSIAVLGAGSLRNSPSDYDPSPPLVQSSQNSDNHLLTSERERAPTPPHGFRLRTLKRREGQVDWCFVFTNARGNEYFCDVDEEYLTDRFNLTGLNTEVQYYQYALDLITDVFDLECEDEMREQIQKSARHLYGLVHARYIVTTRGQQKMMEKFKVGDFGKCPRVACDGQNLLPMGQHDVANMSAVKLYCGRCEDIYNPKSSRHAAIDGAYFGASFHNIFFQVYPHLQPPRTQRRYEPRIYGFKVHASAALARWQAEEREKMKERLKLEGLETGFEAEEGKEQEMDDSEGEEEGQDGIDDMFEGQRVGAPVKR